MKNYKEFNSEYIGFSDIAALTMVGFVKEVGVTPQMLRFGGYSSYDAYIIERETNEEVLIGDHYYKVATFNSWLKIYDDVGRTFKAYGREINIYRAGDYGCIIEVIK